MKVKNGCWKDGIMYCGGLMAWLLGEEESFCCLEKGVAKGGKILENHEQLKTRGSMGKPDKLRDGHSGSNLFNCSLNPL